MFTHYSLSLLAFLLVLSQPTFAASDAEFYQLVAQLGDDEYETRIKADETLSHYDPSYFPKMMACMETEPYSKDPEVVHRLGTVVRKMYINKVLPTEEKWLRHLGYTGINVTLPTPTQNRVNDEDVTESVPGFFVAWVDSEGPAKTVKEYDLVIAVDGIDVTQGFKFPSGLGDRDKAFVKLDSPADYVPRVKPGVEITLVVKRVKIEVLEESDWNVEKLAENKFYNDPSKYDTLTVRFTTVQKSRYWLNEDIIEGLREKYWQEYLNNYKESIRKGK